MEVKGKHIFITGASRGIGRAVAKLLAHDKCHLHLCVRKKDRELEKEMLEEGAASCQQWVADLADPKQVEKLIRDTSEIKIDILFNNAGLLSGGLLESQNLDDVDNMLQVNLQAPIHLTHAFLPRMLHRKRGKIINNSSVSAIMNFPGNSTYGATKAALLAFNNCLQLELKGTGVTTLALITPGIKTRMFDQIGEKFSDFLEVPKESISVTKYAEMIREAILLDLDVLEPKGMTGIGVKVAKYMPQVFKYGVLRKFSR